MFIWSPYVARRYPSHRILRPSNRFAESILSRLILAADFERRRAAGTGRIRRRSKSVRYDTIA
jgi:hypothetical protein